MAGKKKVVTHAELIARVKVKYGPPQWAAFSEVRDAAGFAAHRSLDVMAVGLWPSKGLHLHGFECKTSRADWRRELNDSAKARAFTPYCDYFWIVATPGIVVLEEMPAAWGLLEPRGAGLFVKKAASKRISEPPDMHLIAAMLRRAYEQKPGRNTIKEAEQRGYVRGREQGKAQSYTRQRLADAEKMIKEFEEASGIKLSRYHGGKELGEAVRIVMEADTWRLKRKLKLLVQGSEEVARYAKDALEKLEAAAETETES